MRPIFVRAVGLVGTGLDGWQQASDILRGEAAWQETAPGKFIPGLLPANERRRASKAVRLAFRAAEDALASSEIDVSNMSSVFASSDADTHILDKMCTALAEPSRVVSPTDFHNSVHNAAAGYWHIAVGSRAASSSISAWDASFAAGLLEATTLIEVEAVDCLMTTFDLLAPNTLRSHRPMFGDNAVTMVLSSSQSDDCVARLDMRILTEGVETTMDSPAMEGLRCGCSALKALPILDLIARLESGSVVIRGAGSQFLAVSVSPC